MSESFINFPDILQVTIGAGWKPVWPLANPAPFLEDEVINLIDAGTSLGIGKIYSEDGSQDVSATNRLVIEFYSAYEGDAELGYSQKQIFIRVWDGVHESYGYSIAADIILQLSTPFPENFDFEYYFKDVYDMVSRFGVTTFYSYTLQTNFIDMGSELEQNYVNPMLFKTFGAPVVPILKIFSVLNRIENMSGFIKSFSIKNGMGEQKNFLLPPRNGFQKIFSSVNSIGAYAQNIFLSINSIISASISNIFTVKNSFEGAGINKAFSVVNAIGDLNISAIYPEISYDILIDGYSVKDRISGLEVQMSDGNVHNTFSFNSMDLNLYKICDPEILQATIRAQVSVGTRVFYFLIEERTGNRMGFTVWGRSLTAVLDDPFNEELSFSISTPELASIVAASIAGSVSTSFLIDDWVLPKSFNYVGRKIEGLQAIAETVGGILRSSDAGVVVLRKKYPVRPVNIEASTALIAYDPESNLISLDVKEGNGTKENAIEVQGFVSDELLPQLEIEASPNGTHLIGEDIFVRAFWGIATPPVISEFYSTDGKVKLMKASATVENSETVSFIDGAGSTAYPISRIISTTWIGKAAGNPTFKSLSNEIYITEPQARVATVVYESVYQQYKIYDHNVPILIFVMVINSQQDITVRVLMGDADKEASALSKPFASTENTAVIAGTAYLDDNKYDTTEISIIAPYNDLAQDGIIISADDPNIGLTGKYHVRDCAILFDGPKVLNRITAVKFKVNA